MCESVFLFPGQGSQEPGMLTRLFSSPQIRVNSHACQMKEIVEDTIGAHIDAIDTVQAYDTTVNVQLSLLLVEVVVATYLMENGIVPHFVAGHSMGNFAAAVIAGVLNFEQACSAVHLRGSTMDRIAHADQWAMMAIMGLSVDAIHHLITSSEEYATQLWIAIINSYDQIVVSGSHTALQRLSDVAKNAGARAVRLLDVPTASHCPLQEETAQVVQEFLTNIPLGEQQIPYLSSSTARCLTRNCAAVAQDLATSVALPVRWYDVIRVLPELGVRCAVQIPPGRVLADLMDHSNDHSRISQCSQRMTVTVADIDNLRTTAEVLSNRMR